MAYSPGQPWDETLSYSSGQTCTYKGLPYVFWRPEPFTSTIGVPPNVEMAPFEATNYYSTATRLERAWVLGDRYQGESYIDFHACYGDVRKLQYQIRGSNDQNGYSNAEYTGPQLPGIFPMPGIYDPQPDRSWVFYKQDFGQSVDYNSGGIGNVVIDRSENPRRMIYTTGGPGPIPVLSVVSTTNPSPSTIELGIIFRMGIGEPVGSEACFGKVGHFSVLDGQSPPNVIGSGTASSGPPRDNYYDPASYPVTYVTVSNDYWGLRLDSISPSFSA